MAKSIDRGVWGDWVLGVRRHAGGNQFEFAEKIGMSRQSVADWERGDSKPDLPAIEAIMRAFPNAPQRPPMVFNEAITESASAGVSHPQGKVEVRKLLEAALDRRVAALTSRQTLFLSREIATLATRLSSHPMDEAGAEAYLDILLRALPPG